MPATATSDGSMRVTGRVAAMTVPSRGERTMIVWTPIRSTATGKTTTLVAGRPKRRFCPAVSPVTDVRDADLSRWCCGRWRIDVAFPPPDEPILRAQELADPREAATDEDCSRR